MDINDFNKTLLAQAAASGHCASCALCGRTRVGMDASGNTAGSRPILFIGLNPGREEAQRGLPFVGLAGRFLRECMAETGYGTDIGWAMINSILCSTSNEKAIPDIAACQRHCHENVGAYVKMIRPRVIVPCGNGASALFGLASGIMANSRQTFVSKGPKGRAKPVAVLPLVHPSSLIRNGGRSAPTYGQFIKRLEEIAQVARIFDPDMRGYNLGSYRMLFGSRDE